MVDFDFPLHWDKLMLFQVATEQKISNKNIHHQNLLSLSYGNIKRKDINTHGGLLPTSFDTYQIVNAGNIILRLTDLQNDHKSLRVGFVTETGIITSAYTCLKARENILPQFLYLLLHAYDLNKIFYGMGGGVRQSIGYSDIRKMTIALPPLDEQEKIVRYLDKKTSQISTYINAKKKEIELLGELKRSIISEAVTKGLHSSQSAQRKFIRLKNLVKNISDKKNYLGGNYIGLENIESWSGKITLVNIENDSVESILNSFDERYILFGKLRPYLAKVATPNFSGQCSTELLTLLPRTNIHKKFLFYVMISSWFIDIVHSSTYGTKMPRANWNFIGNIKISVPQLKEQREIADFLDAKCAKIERLIEALQNEIKFVEELRIRIISDVVTGKIDVRELT